VDERGIGTCVPRLDFEEEAGEEKVEDNEADKEEDPEDQDES
jgi:hypothetical protein